MRAGVGLEAAGFSAGAGMAVGELDFHVTEFRGGVVSALKEMSIGHHSAADAGAEGEEDEIVDAFAGAEEKFAERGGVGVILNFHVEAEERLKAIAQGEMR